MSLTAQPLLALNPLSDASDPLSSDPANDTHERADSQPAPLTVDFVRISLTSLRQATASHPVSEALRALYAGQIASEAAARAGRACTTADVLAEVTEALPPVIAAVMAGAVQGFGPCEMSYTLDLATELADHWSARRHHDGVRAAASEEKSMGKDDLTACRSELASMIEGVTPEGTPEHAALARNGRQTGRTAQATLAAIETLATQARAILARGASDAVYGLYLADKGFTEAWLAETLAPVTPASVVGDGHVQARAQVELTQQAIDVLEGRVRHQLLRLRKGVEKARAKGAALTEVRLPRVRRAPSPAKKHAAPTPTPVATPR